ncbi:MAG: thioredoxin family protein [Pseudanabaenaceae cyanobacterium SKYGB_i_bin29]|nr:thioredoxin family protein [Pseudanabaenaceae cyanobacterium SKYG29]MDW8421634.1 thioredoxin family protein [Pseudanabaenaceae cyanobacterium SKYGB_i_bin29]
MHTNVKNSLISLAVVPASLAAIAGFSLFFKTDNVVAATDVKVGAPAPAFTVTDSNGKKHSLSDFKGKTVVLEWTNHECPFVKKHYETDNMQKLQRAATAQGVVWLSVISSAPGQQGFVDAAKANELTKSRNASPTAVILDPDGTFGRLYGARTTPHMFIIAPDGKLAYMGAIDDKPSANKNDVAGARNYISEALEAIKAGRPVAVATTQPYGCSVKYGK